MFIVNSILGFAIVLSHLIEEINGLKRNQSESITLNSVYIVMRHGDRTPTHFYPNDPFESMQSKIWPEGLGQLNKQGKIRSRTAGNLYKQIYEDFLIGKQSRTLLCWSSPRQRTIDTAKLFMKSFLKDSEIDFQILIDEKLLSTSFKCPKADQIWRNYLSSERVRHYRESKKEFIEYLETKTGENYLENEIETLRKIEFLTTTLEIERDEYGLQVEDWIRNRTVIDSLDDIKNHAFLFDWQSPKIQKLRIGYLLERISKAILLHKSKTFTENNGFYLFSTHDVVQVILLQALGVYDQIGTKPPSYASAIVFEYYQQNSDEIERDSSEKKIHSNKKDLIRILYREILNNNQTSEFFIKEKQLIIDQCRYESIAINLTDNSQSKSLNLCPMENFLKAIDEYCLTEKNLIETCNSSERIAISFSLHLSLYICLIILSFTSLNRIKFMLT
ncbi:Lysosomal acid phosphatase [Sarcoptes scabiei]|uniref:acid phosphatase n=1 Tax=Sarcoptes scabiei TaxID=52283 RepID=A0A834RH30_SARSC|nr:Lysosomal acid phosphatase [Sarcoptes scabiei]UXI14073.1 Lysosomal acid phosphatase precursor [Sarcoptes scabiei]